MGSNIIVEIISRDFNNKEHVETLKIIKEVIEELNINNVRIFEKNILENDIVFRYGIILSPSIAINGTLMIIGRVPGKDEIKDLILRANMSI